MTRLTSISEAEKLIGKIPELAILRMRQLEGKDGLYDPSAHGFITVVTEQEDVINDFLDLGEKGLLSGTTDWPIFDYVERFPEGTGYVFEAVLHTNDEAVRVFIVQDAAWLDSRLRTILESYVSSTQLTSPCNP